MLALILSMICSFVEPPFVSPELIEQIAQPYPSCYRNPCTAVEVWNSLSEEEEWEDPVVDRGCEGCFPIYFGYHCIGKTEDGIYVLSTSDRGGGTGNFMGLLFVKLERDGFIEDEKRGERVVAQRVGDYYLGDRWIGEAKVKGNTLFVLTLGYAWGWDGGEPV